MIKRTSYNALCAVFTVIVLVAFSGSVFAQSIPGIYGGAPLSQLGTYRYVQLQGASGDTYTYPLNGILNYVAYYTPSYDPSYVPGGEYSVYYLNAAKQVVAYAGTITYSPNSTETNGVEVSPPNPGTTGALGIQGTEPVANYPGDTTSVTLSGNGINVGTNVNGDGFYSFYYYTPNGNTAGFIPPGTYTLAVTVFIQCPTKTGQTVPLSPGIYSGTTTVTYSPTSTTNPSDPGYYVTGAAVVARPPLKTVRTYNCVYPGS